VGGEIWSGEPSYTEIIIKLVYCYPADWQKGNQGSLTKHSNDRLGQRKKSGCRGYGSRGGVGRYPDQYWGNILGNC